MNSLLGSSTRTEDVREGTPDTKVPLVWLGFIFPVVFFFSEFLMFLPGFGEEQLTPLFLVIVILGMVYWLFCVYKLHKVMNEIAPYGYSISPGEAVGKHFVPILNAIWVFQWPSAMTDYINERGRVRIISGKLIGALFLLSVFLRFLDGAIGLALTFGVTTYLAAKLRRHIELGRSATADQLPPLPTEEIFGHAQTKMAENQTETV